jgi:predicted dehydrogenase
MTKKQLKNAEFNRRDFLRGSSLATVMAMMGGVQIVRAAEEAKPAEGAVPEKKRGLGPPINCGVIGCGVQGRNLITMLGRLPNAPVIAVCDTYAAFVRRGKEAAPKAEGYEDYKLLLANKDVKAVFIATPSHLHKEIALAALAAGKHVYLEAPMAHNIEDAKAIAKAAKAAEKSYFQVGQYMRSEPQRNYMLPYMRAGTIGKPIMMRAQSNKKQTWRRSSSNADREKELNWRLSRETSAGILGEIGIHQIDVVNWFFNQLPTSVSGFGGILGPKNLTDDGRDVPDTVHAFFEYPNGMTLQYDSSLCSSFEGEYQVFYGNDSSILLRGSMLEDSSAWMFKEVDAPMLGWEVYAKKEQFQKETGIVLKVGSTKQALLNPAAAEDPAVAATKTALYSGLESFVINANELIAGLEDFVATFGENAKGLKEYLAGLSKERSRAPACGYQEGFEAAVVAIKANEAILKKENVTFQKEWFEV